VSLLAVSFAGALALGVTFFHYWLFLHSPGGAGREVRLVAIREGMKGADIARQLAAAGIVSDPRRFYLLCRWRKVDHLLKAGEYAFLPLSTPLDILDQLISGKVNILRVTVPEGFTVYQLARVLEHHGLVTEEEILRLVVDRDFIASTGVEAASLEGYLFPETYFFQKTQSGSAMLRAMVQEFRGRLPEGWQAQTARLGIGLHEAVILASMVEKEAVVDEERPIIAGVFFNRLRQKMPLQSDPTAVYDLPGFTGPVTADHLKRPSPYNTYFNRGLPVGPICSPGRKSLLAVLYPAQVPYRFFVSNNDGTHHFSESLSEHNQAVSRTLEKRRNGSRKAGVESGFNLPGGPPGSANNVGPENL
jgi:UPF0755 protein